MSPFASAAPAAATPWLSVLVPVYNVRDYLAECVESVLAQAPADAGVEVLLLDDCSTDGSAEVMAALDARWPGRLRLLRHERNAGLSAARNTMIDAARGDYLWFLDSDDKLLPGAIAGLREVVGLHAPDAVLCDFAVWRERPRLKHRLRGERHRNTFAGPHAALRPGGLLIVETPNPKSLIAGIEAPVNQTVAHVMDHAQAPAGDPAVAGAGEGGHD